MSTAVSIPVIASGGAGTFEHFVDVFTAGRADAALAASIFHYAEHAVARARSSYLRAQRHSGAAQMLIPSIDLQGGRSSSSFRASGWRIETHDVDAWVDAVRGFPKVQLIDLDAAKGAGRQRARWSRRSAAALPCRVGGGIRTIERARRMLAPGRRT